MNKRQIQKGVYICETQAGFRDSLKEYTKEWRECYDYTFKGMTNKVRGYPEEYPCLVSFTVGYQGYEYWIATCIPLSLIK